MSNNQNDETRQSRPEDYIRKRDPNRNQNNSVRQADGAVKVPHWLIIALIPLMVAASGLYVSTTSGQEARALDDEQEEVNGPRFKAIEEEQVTGKLERAANSQAIITLQKSVDANGKVAKETHDLLIIMATKDGIPVPKVEVN